MKNNWLQLRQNKHSANINLVCLPFAGGFAEYFLPWREHLPHEFQLCPIQLPGRSYRWQEPAYLKIQSLLEALVPGVEAMLNEHPYILFGHSMGGYIAYEFCKLLMDRQLPLPTILVVSSLPAPMYWLSKKMLSELSEQDFADFFFDLGGFHPELLKHKQFIKMQMTLLRADITLCESCQYVETAAFPFPILAMGGQNDEYVRIDSMSNWVKETTKEFQFQKFSGKHFYLNDNISAIVSLIKQQALHNDIM